MVANWKNRLLWRYAKKVRLMDQTVNTQSNRACPRCRNLDGKVLLKLKAKSFCDINSTYRKNYSDILGIKPETEFPVSKCSYCGFIYSSWLPPAKFIRRIYDSVIDQKICFEKNLSPDWCGHLFSILSGILMESHRRFNPSLTPIKILDYGCGYGILMRALTAINYPYQAVGLEKNKYALEFMRNTGLNAVSSEKDANKYSPYHIIILNELLEHIPDFRALLQFVNTVLETNGIVWVSVPDFSDKKMRRYLNLASSEHQLPRVLNPLEHLNYFSAVSLAEILFEEGFKPINKNASMDLKYQPDLHGILRLKNTLGVIKRLLSCCFFEPTPSTQLLVEKI